MDKWINSCNLAIKVILIAWKLCFFCNMTLILFLFNFSLVLRFLRQTNFLENWKGKNWEKSSHSYHRFSTSECVPYQRSEDSGDMIVVFVYFSVCYVKGDLVLISEGIARTKEQKWLEIEFTFLWKLPQFTKIAVRSSHIEISMSSSKRAKWYLAWLF